MTCDECGELIAIGDWPFCPHGPGRVTVVRDAIPGGQVIENLGPEPVRVYSETERRKIMKARGLVDAVRHTQGSRLTSNWNTISPQSLKNATELVSRTRAAELDPEAEVETLTLTVTERETGFRVPPNGDAHG